MATIEKFEDLIAWQKARQFAHEVYELTCLDKFSRDYSLVDQTRRSRGSVMDNIAEGFERGGNKEFIHFLFIAKSSLAETKSQLYRAFDRKYILDDVLKEKLEKAVELSKVIGGFINYLLKSDISGRKFNTKSPNSKLGTQNA
ncbi:MAG: four helix bundle protein [Bacteroidales bacterium]|nr:four helix bundle protein [Bacteroidales bacterium]